MTSSLAILRNGCARLFGCYVTPTLTASPRLGMIHVGAANRLSIAVGQLFKGFPSMQVVAGENLYVGNTIRERKRERGGREV